MSAGTGLDDVVEVLEITISVIHSAPSLAVLSGDSLLHTPKDTADIAAAAVEFLLRQEVHIGRVCTLEITARKGTVD